jgi:hypothetical protein
MRVCRRDVPEPPSTTNDRHLAEFYELCGGIEFLDTPQHYGVIISPPAQLLPANPMLIGEQVDDDITSSWYVIGRTFNSELISIDLHPALRTHEDRHSAAGCGLGRFGAAAQPA